MSEKIFIGKVTEKTFTNGGSIIKLSLSPDDKTKLSKDGWDNLEIKQSKGGKWYAEISQFQPQQSGNGRTYQQQPVQPVNGIEQPESDLPF